jgi:hypothetical protein
MHHDRCVPCLLRCCPCTAPRLTLYLGCPCTAGHMRLAVALPPHVTLPGALPGSWQSHAHSGSNSGVCSLVPAFQPPPLNHHHPPAPHPPSKDQGTPKLRPQAKARYITLLQLAISAPSPSMVCWAVVQRPPRLALFPGWSALCTPCTCRVGGPPTVFTRLAWAFPARRAGLNPRVGEEAHAFSEGGS